MCCHLRGCDDQIGSGLCPDMHRSPHVHSYKEETRQSKPITLFRFCRGLSSQGKMTVCSQGGHVDAENHHLQGAELLAAGMGILTKNRKICCSERCDAQRLLQKECRGKLRDNRGHKTKALKDIKALDTDRKSRVLTW